MTTFEYSCKDLNALADYVDLLATRSRESIGTGSKSRDNAFREKAVAFETVAALIRQIRLTGEDSG